MKTIKSVVSVVVSACALLAVPRTQALTAMPSGPGIWRIQREERALTVAHEDELLRSLRRITGLDGLHFTADGALAVGEGAVAYGGAATARETLYRALRGPHAYVIEDHSGSKDVRFGQLDEGTHYVDGDKRHLVVFRVRLDFEDFDRLEAPPEVKDAFDPGFALLHELMHGLGYADAAHPDAIGEVEETLNRARGELGVPLRLQYFGDSWPIGAKLLSVRLRFRSGKRTQYAAFLVDRKVKAAPPR